MFDLNSTNSGLSSVEILYNHQQRVLLKSKKGEEKSRILRISLEMKSGLTISIGKVLSLHITDDNDCTFFYSLLLSQEDFSVLKSQQGLLVDFDHFPSQLIKLLEACRSQEFNKFILVMDEEDIIASNSINDGSRKGFVFLKVIETNNFKNLCHLSLKVLQGSDSDIKNHMSMKITSLMEKLSEEEKQCRKIEMKLTDALKALDGKTKELTEIQLKMTEEKNNLRLEMNQQISEEREKLSKQQMEWQQKLDAEKSLLGKQFQKQINDMNEQMNGLTFNNKNLYEAKCQLETAVKEKVFLIEALEKQNLQLTQEVNLLRKQNSQLDQDYHEKDKAVVGLRTKLAVTEQELKDKIKYLDKQQELLKVANEQKSFLEEALNEKEAHLQRKVTALQNMSADLMKSNEIIAKLQTDLAASKAKMKLRTDIALEQEKILEKKTQEMIIQGETIKELEKKVVKYTEELASVKIQLEDAKKKSEEKDVVIKKNENVISWLNRRLTESTSGLSSGTTLINSSRSGNESVFGASLPKGTISNLTKGWPPWLVNSVAGNSQGDSTGISNSTNGIQQLSQSSASVEISPDQSKARLQKPENSVTDQKESKTETKSKGLDPKYFQSCTDKDYILNPQVSKLNSNLKSSNCTTKPPASGRQLPSAYFPKNTVPL